MPETKSVLIITYYWPPSGGAAVQRWLSFANNLVEQGVIVHVLTVNEKYATYQLRDESLLQQVNPAIRVYTTKTREPFKAFTFLFGKKSLPKPAFSNESNPSVLKKISRFIRGNFFIPDPRKGWKPYAVTAASTIIAREKINCVITAGPPHSTHFIGKALKEKLGVYWIADFHDLWTDVIYYDLLYHLPVIKKLDRKLERSILESADKILTVGEKYKRKLLSKSATLPVDKIDILRIGYDEKVMAGIEEIEASEEFIITYTGTISDFYYPGVFIAALKTVVEKYPDVLFRLVFAGILSGDIKNKITDAGLGPNLKYLGYVSHKESLRLLKAATVLLLVNPVTRDEEMVIPGKIYEYLAAGKPIINISKHTAETASIIDTCDAGKTFERTEQKELEIYLSALATEWEKKKSLDIKYSQSQVVQYSRKKITEELIGLLNNNHC